MKRKDFAVIGLGDFGSSVALQLARQGANVLAVDVDEKKVSAIADHVTHAVTADMMDSDAIRSLGMAEMDALIIGIGDHLEASIMTVIIAKEEGVPFVIAKAKSDMQAAVLKKVGADQVIFPEQAMGDRLARNLSAGNFADYIELSGKCSMVEVNVPKQWADKSLRELKLRSLGLNVIAKKEEDDVIVSLDPDKPLQKGDIYILIGANSDLEKIPTE